MQRWRENGSIDFHQISFEHTNWAKIDAREVFFIVKINPFSAKQVVYIRLRGRMPNIGRRVAGK